MKEEISERDVIEMEIVILEGRIKKDWVSTFQKKIEKLSLNKKLELSRLLAAMGITGILPEQKAMRGYLKKILEAPSEGLIDVDPRDLGLNP